MKLSRVVWILIVLIAFVALVGFFLSQADAAYAAEVPVPGESLPWRYFEWELTWDRPEDGDFKTESYLRTGVVTNITTTVYYQQIPPSTVTDSVDQIGLRKTFSSTPWNVIGFDIGTSADPQLAKTWQYKNCGWIETSLVRWSAHDVQLHITNHTGQMLYYLTSQGWQDLPPGLTIPSVGLQGEVLIADNIAGSFLDWCNSLKWDWLAFRQPVVHSVTPNPVRPGEVLTIQGVFPVELSPKAVRYENAEGSQVWVIGEAAQGSCTWLGTAIACVMPNNIPPTQGGVVVVSYGHKEATAPLDVAPAQTKKAYMPLVQN